MYSRQAPEKSREQLRAAYRNSLQQAVQHDFRSVAFPSISTGVYGYPIQSACATAMDEVKQFLSGPQGDKLDLVVFCCFSQSDLHVYEQEAPKVFGL